MKRHPERTQRDIQKGHTMTDPRTQTLDVPGARLRYDIRDAEAESTAPPLLMIGLPMDASGFGSLAEHFRDRTVVTYDPRGVGRSERTNGAGESSPEQHADDLHETNAREGFGAAMTKFLAPTSVKGRTPAGLGDQAPSNPADFGLPTED